MTFMKDNWCCDPSFVSKGIIIGHEIQMQMGLDTSYTCQQACSATATT